MFVIKEAEQGQKQYQKVVDKRFDFANTATISVRDSLYAVKTGDCLTCKYTNLSDPSKLFKKTIDHPVEVTERGVAGNEIKFQLSRFSIAAIQAQFIILTGGMHQVFIDNFSLEARFEDDEFYVNKE